MRPANLLNRLRIGRAQPGGGGGVAGGERADVPALDAGLTWEAGEAGLVGRRLGRASGRRVPADRAEEVERLYRERHPGFTVSLPRASHQGPRLWLGLRLAQAASAVVGRRAEGAAQGGASEQARAAAAAGHDAAPEPAPAKAGDGARHAWLEGQAALDLSVTLDDATGAIHSAFLIEEEGTASTFRALKEVFVEHGLPMSLFTDRGAHDFRTTKAGEIDRGCPTPGRPGARTTGRRAHRSLFAP